MNKKVDYKVTQITAINDVMLDVGERRMTKQVGVEKLTDMIEPIGKTTSKHKKEITEKLAYAIKFVSKMK